jgi:hypothetical protein
MCDWGRLFASEGNGRSPLCAQRPPGPDCFRLLPLPPKKLFRAVASNSSTFFRPDEKAQVAVVRKKRWCAIQGSNL